MTKRIRAKHKVDRRLRVNLWGKPKSPFNTRNYPPGQHGQNKNWNHTMEILMRDNLEMFIEKLLRKKEIQQKI